MRVVADTNVIISMLLWGKSLERLLVSVNTRKITLCFSPDTIDELFEVINYPRIKKQAYNLKVPVETLIDKLLAVSEIVYPAQRISLITDDPSDNRILEAAVVAKVDYIISGDRHLLRIKQIAGIPILTPAQFLKLL